jgi:proteasome lid subunit RPN8/RPN11
MGTPAFQRLLIPQSVHAGMVWHALAERPLECCGILAGVITPEGLGKVCLRYPLLNAADSPIAFESDPASLFSAWNDIRRQGLVVLAIYHSHPTSEPVPSRTDLARNWSCEVINVILSMTSDPPQIRAWWLSATTYNEAVWELVE